jgi:hypothetical protein
VLGSSRSTGSSRGYGYEITSADVWDASPCPRQTTRYTERMFGYDDPVPPLGSRRFGGPLPMKTVLPALVQELHQACVARGGPAALDLLRALTEAEAMGESAAGSFSRAA